MGPQRDPETSSDLPALSARGSRPSPRTSDEAVSRGNSRRSLDGGATCRKTAISRSALDKNAMPRHLFEDSVDEGTTRRGTDTPVHRPEKPTGSTHSSTRGLSPRAQLERQAEFHSPHRTRPDSPVPNLLGPCNPNQKWRGTLRFLPQLEMRPSSIAPKPLESREVPPTHSVPDFSEAP